MGLEIYEDPVTESRKTMPVVPQTRKASTSGRTPLGKRTNHHDADNDGKPKGLSKSRIHNIQGQMEGKPQSKHDNTQLADRKQQTTNNTTRRVRFGEMNDPENATSANTTSTTNESKQTTTSTTTLQEFRRKLKSTMSSPKVPPTPEQAPMRPSVTKNLFSPLSTELESTPDDSLLFSPSLIAPVASRPSRLPLQRVTKGILSQKPQRVFGPSKSTDPTVDGIPLESNESNDRKVETRYTLNIEHRKLSKSESPLVPKDQQTSASREISKETNRVQNEQKVTARSTNAHPTRLSRRVPSPAVYKTSDSSNKAIEKNHSIRAVSTKLQRKASTRSSTRLITAVSGQKEKPVEGPLELHMQPEPTPGKEAARAPMTSDASAWKVAQTNVFSDSPVPPTPGGLCLDLSSMFQKAHARPPTAVKATLSATPVTTKKTIVSLPSVPATPSVAAAQAKQQAEIFSAWLNATLCPEDDANAENDPWRGLAVHQRMAKIRQQGQSIWQSNSMKNGRQILEREITNQKLQIRSDRDLYSNLTHRNAILQLLMDSYETPWLRLGLETLFNEAIVPGMQLKTVKEPRFDRKPKEKTKLTRMQVTIRDFIVFRVLSDDRVLAKYTKGKCKLPSGQFEVEFKAEMRSLVLYRILVLFLFLDQAKQAHLLEQTLFQTNSAQKSSKDMLAVFCQLFLAHTGNIVKQLNRVGLSVHHKQEPLDELDFAIRNLATDLRDGVRLARLTEILTTSPYQSLLKQLRLPAVSRLPKLHNVGLVLARLNEEFTIPSGIAPHHVVDGHREKVLQLLWTLVAHFHLPSLVNLQAITKEIRRIKLSRGVHSPSPQKVSDTNLDEAALVQLMLQWTNLVISDFGLSVANLTNDWADGVVICLLIHFYQPDILRRDEILPTERPSTSFLSRLPGNLSKELIRQNERNNWQLARRRMEQLGAIAVLPLADSDHPPQERTTLMGVAFLCHRLIECGAHIRACCLLQRLVRRKRRLADWEAKIAGTQKIVRVWYKYRENYFRARYEKYGLAVLLIEQFVSERLWRLGELKEVRLRREEYRNAATKLEAFARRCIARKNFCFLVSQNTAAITLQSLWRLLMARQQHQELKRRLDASLLLQHWWRRQQDLARLRLHSATRIQKIWRGFWARIQYDILYLDAIDLQKYIRRGLAVCRLRKRENAVAVIHRTFLRYQFCQRAREIRQHLLHTRAASTCQKYVRRHQSLRKYHVLRERHFSCLKIQTSWRRLVHQSAYSIRRSHAIILQSHFRRHLALSTFQNLVRSVIRVQSIWRKMLSEGRFRMQYQALSFLQRILRRWKAKQEARLRRKAIVQVQCAYRSFQSRLRLKTLKAARLYSACEKIQSWWRSKIVRSSFSSQRIAAIRIQSLKRKYFQLQSFRHLRETTILVQSMYRSKATRFHYVSTLRKITVCQSYARAALSRKRSMQRQYAIVRIQAVARMWKAKAFVRLEISKRNMFMNSAALLIQRNWRSFSALTKFQFAVAQTVAIQSFLRKQIAFQKFEQCKHASILIQTRYRIRSANKKLILLQLEFREKVRREGWSATCMQAHIRGWSTRSWMTRQRSAAVHIQRLFRGHTAMLRFRTAYEATLKVQSWSRRLIALHVARGRWQGILLIQSIARMHIARTKFRLLQRNEMERSAATIIQCAFRCNIAGNLYDRLTQEHWQALEYEYAAVSIQRAFRSYMIYFRAARSIQTTWRCYTVHADYLLSILAAISIQSSLRRLFGRQEANLRFYAVYILQQFGRDVIRRLRRQRLIRNVVTVQSVARGRRVRREHDLRVFAATILQRNVRGYLEREYILYQKFVVIEIQRVWRGFSVHLDFCLLRISVIKIQSAFRRYSAQLLRDGIQNGRIAEKMRMRHSARLIQSAFRAHVMYCMQLHAAFVIQTAWRNYISRCTIAILRHGMIKLQSRFRGCVTRKRRPSRIRTILSRIKRLDVQPHLLLGNRTTKALDVLANSTSLSEIMEAVRTLEVTTRWSAECSRQLVRANATNILFTLIRTCNRSRPHVEVLKVVLIVLVNVSGHCGWDDSYSEGVEVCVDLVQMFRDKAEVFVQAVRLLDLAVRLSAYAREWCGSHETARRLRSVHALCLRKLSSVGVNGDKDLRRAIKTLQRIVESVSK